MNKLACTLLVDDDDTANYLNELLLKRFALSDKIIVARNGFEALHIVKDSCPGPNCPNLILLDINMPIMDGFEFLEAFNKLDFDQKQSIVIVMLTTSLHPQDLQKIEQANIAGFINKPLTSKALQQIVAQHFS